jgi:hypothetical protein
MRPGKSGKRLVNKNFFDFFDFVVKILILCGSGSRNDLICAGPGWVALGAGKGNARMVLKLFCYVTDLSGGQV